MRKGEREEEEGERRKEGRGGRRREGKGGRREGGGKEGRGLLYPVDSD